MARPDTLHVQRDGPLALLTLDRVECRNALDTALVNALRAALDELSGSSSPVRVLVLSGAGRDFCAGADLRELDHMSPDAARAFADSGHALCHSLEQAPFPVIAAVRGVALGAGFELALACDLVIAARDARFGLPEVRLGVTPGFGGTQRLVRRLGLPVGRELCYSGRQLGAERARAMGLVTHVVNVDELAARARREAEAIADRPPLAIRAIKQITGAGAELELRAACELEAQAFAKLFTTRDAREGIRAFLEQRDPEFRGE